MPAAKVWPKPTDWEHFGCPSCGRLETLPSSKDEEPPFCVGQHSDMGDGSVRVGVNYAWRRSEWDEIDAYPDGHPPEWVQMVRVKVEPA